MAGHKAVLCNWCTSTHVSGTGDRCHSGDIAVSPLKITALVGYAQQRTLTRACPPQLGDLTEFKKLGWANPSDSAQSRLKGSCSHHTDHRAAEAGRGWQPRSAGTTKPSNGSAEATSASGKPTGENRILPPSDLRYFESVHCVFPFFSGRLCCSANRLTASTTHLPHHSSLGEQGYRPPGVARAVTRQTRLLGQPSPASGSWFTIFPSYLTFPLALFSVHCSGSRSSWLSSVEVWGSKRNASEVRSDAQSCSRLFLKAKPMLCSMAFFRRCLKHLQDQVLPEAAGHYSATASEKVV